MAEVLQLPRGQAVGLLIDQKPRKNCDQAMKLQYDTEAVRRFCRERGIVRLEIFGSALRDDFRPGSDVDLLCTLKPDSDCTLLGWADMQFKLEEIFGRPVDLVSRWGIERSRNPYRRHAILSTATPIYVEG